MCLLRFLNLSFQTSIGEGDFSNLMYACSICRSECIMNWVNNLDAFKEAYPHVSGALVHKGTRGRR